ncbi:facilitated trehalose transporter Tret1-like [Anticarsia gemmatalis]|uniref:facilitated trehalose transporter Tret1-like n=1 Tax=Anticarsia gemmatalis TaxID=129554 RepID=UPI003F763336
MSLCGDIDSQNKKFEWIHFLRQLLICSGAFSSFFVMGLNTGAPTVLVPQLRQETNSTDAVTPEQASWLPALFAFCGLPWVFILPISATYLGRRITHSIVSISSLIGFIMCYCSSDIKPILISQVFQGAVMGSHMTIFIMVVTEYSSKEYRGMFLTFKSATYFWGVLVANTIGTFFHWKNIPLLAIVCLAYNLVTVYFWPESPLWLADKGHFDKCTKSHRWLIGSSSSSEKELEKLIAVKLNDKVNISLRFKVLNIVKTVKSRQFYKPLLLAILIKSLYTFSGKLVYTVYAVEILKKITNNTSAAYTGMLIIDAVTVLSMYVGCVFSKLFKRRTLLLTASSIGVTFLFLLSLYLYLVKLSVVSENKYISILLLVGFSVAIGCGIMILSSCISGEMLPIESRSVSSCAMGLIYLFFYGTSVKVAPYLFATLGTHGTFFLFGIFSVICLVLIYFYIPETKDKTLQEISDWMRNIKPVEEMKELLPVKSNVTIVPKKQNLEETS